jgi:hypothetical protein
MEEGARRGGRFPSDQAFVVQIARDDQARTELRGRIEHVASGDVGYFESLGDLGAFVLRILGLRAGGAGSDEETP